MFLWLLNTCRLVRKLATIVSLRNNVLTSWHLILKSFGNVLLTHLGSSTCPATGIRQGNLCEDPDLDWLCSLLDSHWPAQYLTHSIWSEIIYYIIEWINSKELGDKDFITPQFSSQAGHVHSYSKTIRYLLNRSSFLFFFFFFFNLCAWLFFSLLCSFYFYFLKFIYFFHLFLLVGG